MIDPRSRLSGYIFGICAQFFFIHAFRISPGDWSWGRTDTDAYIFSRWRLLIRRSYPMLAGHTCAKRINFIIRIIFILTAIFPSTFFFSKMTFFIFRRSTLRIEVGVFNNSTGAPNPPAGCPDSPQTKPPLDLWRPIRWGLTWCVIKDATYIYEGRFVLEQYLFI